mmetsp:Transcript_6974/g.10511  ORF Transcript_6974/g.10511 Transcript_6974/m.10511 type:complete len:92 (-) Transcript_6974:289-564(-)
MGTKSVTICIKDYYEEQPPQYYKVESTAALGDVLKDYSRSFMQKYDPTTLRFIFDGERIHPDDTPTSLDMEEDEDNQIDCMLEQIGATSMT